ncbi:hypothetical protein Cgig2_019560 [Carnegiea gigantea]|uniref:Protein kinase domain-containing protein n=1 Tax=Carnegiea gigantea TaxID=171969 RepID=A0A9Q1KGU3_9CARY|nr:hypothetical protein Cgig2_019560 [Carnegiea gigantea]
MQHLSGQPNIVDFKGAYDDQTSVYLMMELGDGGELFYRIITKGYYSEKAAASILRQIVNVVDMCHFMGVHRDLKPNNFLPSSKGKNSLLKATHFGLSVCESSSDKIYQDIVVVLTMLLLTYYAASMVRKPTFGVLESCCAFYLVVCLHFGQLNCLSCSNQPSISNGAKDIVRRMLTQHPKRRITAAQVLNKPIDNIVLSRMQQFRVMSKLKKLAFKVGKLIDASYKLLISLKETKVIAKNLPKE